MNVKPVRSGFTMIELVIVMAVMSILTVAAIKGHLYIARAKYDGVARQVKALREASIAWRYTKGREDYSGISMTELIRSGLVRSEDTGNFMNGQNTVNAGTPSTVLQITSEIQSEEGCLQVRDILFGIYGNEPVITCDSSGVLTVTFNDG